jgi:hypothetical protein
MIAWTTAGFSCSSMRNVARECRQRLWKPNRFTISPSRHREGSLQSFLFFKFGISGGVKRVKLAIIVHRQRKELLGCE